MSRPTPAAASVGSLVRSLAMAALLATPSFAQVDAAAVPEDAPRVVEPAWLAERLTRPDVVVLHISHDDYAGGHIAGARDLPYDRLIARRDGLSSELPDADALRKVFESVGVNANSHVVIYAHEGPMATRALYTLAWLGHARYSYLDGGLARWRAEGRPVSLDAPRVAAGAFPVQPIRPVIADAAYVQERLGRAGTAFIDTRTDGEYNGTGNRSGMPSAGHLDGARQLEWEQLFEADRVRLKPRAELLRLFGERTKPGDAVVTYCWVGYRASATWFVAHHLGYDARMYDGSYQDWQARKLPTKAGTTP